MSKQKPENWGIKYPNYQAYLIKHGLLKNAFQAILFYLFRSIFHYENFIQMEAILDIPLLFFIMLIIDYFLIYRPNKKIEEYNS